MNKIKTIITKYFQFKKILFLKYARILVILRNEVTQGSRLRSLKLFLLTEKNIQKHLAIALCATADGSLRSLHSLRMTRVREFFQKLVIFFTSRLKVLSYITVLVLLHTRFLSCAVAYHNLTDEEQKSRQAVLAQKLATIQALQNGDPATVRCFSESTKFLPADKKSKEKKGERNERKCCVCS